MRTAQHGFTLLELLIVIGILAILLLLAIPSTQNRIVRDQVQEALPLADVAKKPVAAAWGIAQALPADNRAAGLPAADKIVSNLVSSVQVESGAVHMTFGNHASGLLKGKVLTLRPAVVEDAPIVPVAWVCAYAKAPDKMTVKGQDKTDIPENHLPRICRSSG